MLDHLTRSGHVHPTFFVRPKAGFECGIYGPGAGQPEQVKVPRLFATYLGVGAKVCSPPAIDRQFKTIDFFVVFDFQEMDAKTRRLFLAN
jgi:putative hemolysin